MPFKRPLPPSTSPSARTSAHTSSSPAFQHLPRKRAQVQSPSASQSTSPWVRIYASASASPPLHQPSLPLPHNDSRVDVSEDDLEASGGTLSEIVLAIDMRSRSTIGAAFYVAHEQKLYLLSDVKFGGLPILEQVRVCVQPTVILIPSRVDESVDRLLDPAQNRGNVGGGCWDKPAEERRDGRWVDPWILEVRPSNEFNVESGKVKLADLEINLGAEHKENIEMEFVVPGNENPYESYANGLQVGFTGRKGRMLRLGGQIDLESDLSVGCAGAVLTYLKRRRYVGWTPGEVNVGENRRVDEIKMFGLEETMFLNADALSSLQIVRSESHPHSHNQGPSNTSGSKEDLSVYGLFHHLAKTPQGKYLLRQYFLRPSLDLGLIQERHDTLGTFLRPDNEAFFGEILKSLKSIKNMRTVMIHLRKGMSNGVSKGGGIKSGVWTSLRSFAFHVLGIRTACLNVIDGDRLAITSKVAETFHERELKIIGRMVTDTIDFPTSFENHRTTVNPGVDDELDNLKRLYDGIEDLLGEASRKIADSIPQRYGIDLNVVFFPQIGFLICMPADPQTGRAEWEGGNDDDEAWERIFSTQDRVYYKDSRMTELDLSIGDVYANICDKEIEIVHALAQRVLEYEQLLCIISDVCGELDSLLALAQGARYYKLTRPRMTDENVVQIQNGRHMLQELIVPACIANGAHLVGGSGSSNSSSPGTDQCPSQSATEASLGHGPSMLIMTGPNYSGKSVYLKQVALIVYLAHIGSFVPAEAATIGLTDKILTRISTGETVSKAQSAFTIDCQQVASAINLATRRSLIVIDEFGKGTNGTDGAGLVCGVFEYLLRLGNHCPKVLGATHFHEIFENGFLASRPALAFGHMEVRIEGNATEAEDQVTYLYSLQDGRNLSSFGTLCAALNGIDKAVVSRAQDLIILAAQGEDLVTACACISDEELDNLKDAEDSARCLLEEDFLEQQQGHPQIDYKHFLAEILRG